MITAVAVAKACHAALSQLVTNVAPWDELLPVQQEANVREVLNLLAHRPKEPSFSESVCLGIIDAVKPASPLRVPLIGEPA